MLTCNFLYHFSESNDNFAEGNQDDDGNTSDLPNPSFRCPLCQENYPNYTALETHVMHIHSVNSEGLQRLLMLMEGSHWLNNNNNNNSSNNNDNCQGNSSPSPGSVSDEEINESRKENEEENSSIAGSSKNVSDTNPKTSSPLTFNNDGIQASIGTISERHVYKYRCSHCSLAFKTSEKLALHSQYHAIRDSTKCRLCSRSFRSIQALLKHVETGHNDVPSEDLAQYKLALMNHPLLIAGFSGQLLDPTTTELPKNQSSGASNNNDNDDEADDDIM